MVSSLTTFALDGVTPQRVTVEVDVRAGLPAFTVVGLGDRAVRESRERVRAAIQNAGWSFPQQRVTVNLAPADLRKEGPGFDLAIACAVLVAIGEIPPQAHAEVAVFGELALGGEIRPSRGVLAVAEGASMSGLRSIVVPAGQVAEAAVASDIAVFGARDLKEVAAILAGRSEGQPASVAAPGPAAPGPDLADVRGHAGAIRALTIAAAGGHHLLLSGSPGTGKSMLARRLPGILPPLLAGEALEVLRIRSLTGLPISSPEPDRPFRAPHHSISASGLVGGGVIPTPGEITLAHRGVLFLDELSEFSRPTLEALRQPLEDGSLTVVRGQRATTFPASVQLVAATNPCPCGHFGTHRCTCGEPEIEQYRRRLSGPLLDRIDLRVDVHRPTEEQLAAASVTDTSTVAGQVLAARERQLARAPDAGSPWNSALGPAQVRALRRSAGADDALGRAYRRGLISPRGRDRALRVARTIADLEAADRIGTSHLLEALALRTALAPAEVAA